MALLEIGPPVLARALQAFSLPVGSLKAMHLASAAFFREQGRTSLPASYEARLTFAARPLGIETYNR